MPNKTKGKRPAPGTRKRFKQGTHKKAEGCRPGNGNKADTPAIIANSIFALTLAPKKGHECFGEEVSVFEKPVVQINSDLLHCLNRALKLIHKAPAFDPYANAVTPGDVFNNIIEEFKTKILPLGFKYNIDKDSDHDSYIFTVFKEVEWADHWHYFPINKIISYLEKKDKKLLNLFICTLSALRKIADFNAWFDNLYAYDMIINDEYGRSDYLMNIEEGGFDLEEEKRCAAANEFLSDVDLFTKGTAAAYRDRILKAPFVIKNIEKGISAYRSNNRIACWIKQALDLLNDKECLQNFNYHNEDEWDGAVRLEDQVTIIWSEDDSVFNITCEYMDNEAANFGTIQPIINFPITATNRFIPLERIPVAENWMNKITALFKSFHTINDILK